MKARVKAIIKPIFFRLPVKVRARLIALYLKAFGSKFQQREVSITGNVSLLSALNSTGKSVLLFPVIDWNFRTQRPQHLAKEMSKLGCRVVYFTTQFSYSKVPGFKIVENPEENVIVVSLNLNVLGLNIYKDKLSFDNISFLSHSVAAVRGALGLGHTISVVNLPFWRELAEVLPANNIVYDCMDHHAGFENNDDKMLDEEIKLFKSSDLVITTATRLSEHVSKYVPNVIVRNGAEVDYFAKALNTKRDTQKRPKIGYYGAVAEWFDLDLVIEAADKLPEYDFEIIGNVTIDVSSAARLNNIKFLGECPYNELTNYLNEFDVCIIPFKLIELTLCTNPVKVYEYLAAGKPVVATAMPEVVAINEMLHVARDKNEFVDKIKAAYGESENQELAFKRSRWAEGHSWANRGIQLLEEIDKLENKKVSIIVLTYNNLNLTIDCLNSIEKNTAYNNYEVIIVDNQSTDDTREYLSENYSNKENYTVILNDENLGFAGGNNIGLEVATGDILVILNNDTVVSPFWLGAMVNALKENPDLGMVGPVTNNIGNESKINISYNNWSEMTEAALSYTTKNITKIYDIECLAFFCVAIRREVYEEIGGLCLDYGLGFFEDDDYCMRVKKLGWKLGCVESSFVHHHLSASFNKLANNRKQQLMNENKKKFEAKWGEWKPHTYRKGVN